MTAAPLPAPLALPTAAESRARLDALDARRNEANALAVETQAHALVLIEAEALAALADLEADDAEGAQTCLKALLIRLAALRADPLGAGPNIVSLAVARAGRAGL